MPEKTSASREASIRDPIHRRYISGLAFVDFMIHSVLQHVVREKLRKHYVELSDFNWVKSILYESGTILGRLRCNKLKILEKALALPGNNNRDMDCIPYHDAEVPSLKEYQSKAKEHLDEYIKSFKTEPNTFREFYFQRALSNAGLEYADFWELYNLESRKAFEVFHTKVPLTTSYHGFYLPKEKETQADVRMLVLEGIGFGSAFPELTEKMNVNSSTLNRTLIDEWTYTKYTKAQCPKPRVLSLKQQEGAILGLLAYYIETEYPELLTSLALKRYCSINFLSFRYYSWVEELYYIFLANGYLPRPFRQ